MTRCLSCNSHNIGYPLPQVATPAGGLYVQVQQVARSDGGGAGFQDLILVSSVGRFLSENDVDTSRGKCLDCGAEVRA